jgi:hypothetical protein
MDGGVVVSRGRWYGGERRVCTAETGWTGMCTLRLVVAQPTTTSAHLHLAGSLSITNPPHSFDPVDTDRLVLRFHFFHLFVLALLPRFIYNTGAYFTLIICVPHLISEIQTKTAAPRMRLS